MFIIRRGESYKFSISMQKTKKLNERIKEELIFGMQIYIVITS